MKLPDDSTSIKEGIHAIAADGAWTTDPAAAWAIADLEQSGITPPGAEAFRVAYTTDRGRIADLLNRSSGLPGGCCIVFPYLTATGSPTEYSRLKPEKPRTETRNGGERVVKYDAPTRRPAQLYVPPAAPALTDPGTELIITEGEKKTIALNQHGFLAVGMSGVWALLKKREGVERGRSYEDYEFGWPAGLPLAGRRIPLVLDSDTREKSNLPLAVKYLCQHLTARGADVRVVELPNGANGDKVGADDFLLAHGPDALRAILNAASAPPGCGKQEKRRDDDGDSGKGPPVAEVLTAIGLGCDLWHDAEDRAFAATGRRSVAVKSKAFRMRLVADYRRQTGGKVPNAEALTAALLSIEAAAVLDGPLCDANVRVGEHGGRVYVHLADDADTVIEIDAGGWRECPTPPIRFVRARGMQALPMPRPGGRLDDLRRVINAPDDATFALVRAWFAQAFRKHGPFPLLVLLGEQGSAKTTTSRVLKRSIDPREADVRAEPKEARDLMIGAMHNCVLAFDNLSGLPDWLSDALCRLSTGGSFSTRGLYTDDEEVTFSAKRPVILNGIEDIVTRADLLERCLVICHPPIPEDRRRTEADVGAEFEALAPGLLGAVFVYVAGGLRELPRLEPGPLPRMADFARFAMACEVGRTGTCAEFLAAYRENQTGANLQVLDTSPVAAAVQKFMAGRDEWVGTPTELLELLKPLAPDEKDREWPKKANGLSNKLKRLAPSLRRAAQLDVRTGEKDTDRNRSRRVVIRRLVEDARGGSSASSTPPGDADTLAPPPDDLGAADRPVIVRPSSGPGRETSPECSGPDDLDGADDLSRASDGRPSDAPITFAAGRTEGRV